MLGGPVSEDIRLNRRLELDFLIRELAVNSPFDLTSLLHHLKGQCQLQGVSWIFVRTVVPARERPFFSLPVHQFSNGAAVSPDVPSPIGVIRKTMTRT